MADREVRINIIGDNRDAVKSFREVSDIAAQTESKLKGVGSKLTSLGQSTAIVSGSAAVGLGAVLKVAGDFEAAIQKLNATTNATSEEMKLLSDQAKEMGSSTLFSATQAAEAQNFLAQAGFDTNQILTALPSTLELATAGNLELALAADIASNVLTGFNLKASEMGRLSDVMAEAARSSNTNVTQLGMAMKYVAPISQSAGQSLESTTAIIGKLSDAGIQGESAGTTLRGAISSLLNPSKNAAFTLKELGVSATDSSGQLRAMIDIIRDLEKAGASTSQIIQIFGVEAGTGMASLISQGSGSISELEAKLLSANGTARDMADTMSKGLNAQMASLRSALEGLALAIADTGILQTATTGIQLAANLLRGISALPKPILSIITVLTVLVAGLSPVLILAGQLITAYTTLAPIIATVGGAFAAINAPILIIIASITALVVATTLIIKNWDKISNYIFNLWSNKIKPAFDNLVSGALNAGKQMVVMFARGIAATAFAPVRAVAEVVNRVRAYLPSSPAKVGALSDIDQLDMMTPLANSIKHNSKPVIDRINNATQTIRNNIGSNMTPGTGAQSGSVNITIDYRPEVVAQNGEDIIEQLRIHARELIDLIERSQDRVNRGNFA